MAFVQESESDGDEDWSDAPFEAKCLFSEEIVESAAAVFAEAKANHGFDFKKISRNIGLDFYGKIKVLNFIRSKVMNGATSVEVLTELQNGNSWKEEQYLRPALENDSILFQLEDDPPEKKTLEQQNAELKSVIKNLLEEQEKMKTSYQELLYSIKLDGDGEEEAEIDPSYDYYFNGYASYTIHETMLRDEVRTQTYLNSIKNNAEFFKNKIVLDVGCGSGILSMFAASHGASQVFAVDASNIIQKAEKVFEKNGFTDVIQTFRGKIEEIDLPCKVDIIISEWMGYLLLFENMLPSVLNARDRYLAPGGLLFPNNAEIFCFGLSYVESKQKFWQNCYGFNLEDVYEAPDNQNVHILSANADSILTDFVSIKEINIDVVEDCDLDFEYSGHLTCQSSGVIDAIGFHFDCMFPNNICLSTSPKEPDTHWYQSLLFLPQPLEVLEAEEISFQLSITRQNENKRNYDVLLHLKHKDISLQKLYSLVA